MYEIIENFINKSSEITNNIVASVFGGESLVTNKTNKEVPYYKKYKKYPDKFGPGIGLDTRSIFAEYDPISSKQINKLFKDDININIYYIVHRDFIGGFIDDNYIFPSTSNNSLPNRAITLGEFNGINASTNNLFVSLYNSYKSIGENKIVLKYDPVDKKFYANNVKNITIIMRKEVIDILSKSELNAYIIEEIHKNISTCYNIYLSLLKIPYIASLIFYIPILLLSIPAMYSKRRHKHDDLLFKWHITTLIPLLSCIFIRAYAERKHEISADNFSKECGYSEELIRAIRKVFGIKKNPKPSKIPSSFIIKTLINLISLFRSHNDALKRIENLKNKEV